MSRIIKSAAFAIAALGAITLAAPEAMAWGGHHHGGGGHHHGGSFGRHGGFGGHHHHGGWGHHHRHYHWGYRPRVYAYGGGYCRWKRYVDYYGQIVVRRVCY